MNYTQQHNTQGEREREREREGETHTKNIVRGYLFE